MRQRALSLKDSASILGVHPDTIRRAIKTGKLKAAKIGRDYRIAKSELERYFQAMGGTSLFGDDDSQKTI
jgi:excisionase family DNA binding protein